MSVARYSREVTLDDLNNVHTLAILSVPAGSRVLDLGAAEGTVARALAARGCEVTAVERDAEGVAVLRGHGIRTLHADLGTLPIDALPAAAYDVVLLLDVLEHLVHPEQVLARVPAWLAPGGRVLLSVPNVAHAAVRLALLQGTFPRGDVGLLDRTHLHFFDRQELAALLERAGFAIGRQLTVERDIGETEIPVDLDAVSPDVVSAVTADPEARIYQYFVVAQPAHALVTEPQLAEALQRQLHRVERMYRGLESHASRVHAELLLVQEHRDGLEVAYRDLERHCGELRQDGQARRERLELLEASHSSERARVDELADTRADRDVLRQQLRERMSELEASADVQAVLQREIAVQRAFAAELSAQVPRIAALGGEARVLDELERFRAVNATPQQAAVVAADAAAYRRLQDALAIRLLARLDALLRRVPAVRAGLRRVARTVARRRG